MKLIIGAIAATLGAGLLWTPLPVAARTIGGEGPPPPCSQRATLAPGQTTNGQVSFSGGATQSCVSVPDVGTYGQRSNSYSGGYRDSGGGTSWNPATRGGQPCGGYTLTGQNTQILPADPNPFARGRDYQVWTGAGPTGVSTLTTPWTTRTGGNRYDNVPATTTSASYYWPLQTNLADVTVTGGNWDPTGNYCLGAGVKGATYSLQPSPVAQPGNATPPAPPGQILLTQQLINATASVPAAQVVTTAPKNYITQLPVCFSLTPPPVDPVGSPPQIVSVVGPQDAMGAVAVFNYVLKVQASGMIHWDFGDGRQEDHTVAESGNCVHHTYKQISGIGPNPPQGPTIKASQDVEVMSYVTWYTGDGTTHYQCVGLGGAMGATYTTQNDAEMGCSFASPAAIVHRPLAPKPIYQVEVVNVVH